MRNKAAEMKKHILLVDDEYIIALNEAELLKKHDFDVTVVSDGESAVDEIREKTYDLILMDIDLGPGRMNGVDTAGIILEISDLPIVFVTNHGEKEAVDMVKGITRYGYVLKDSGEFVLVESVHMALQLFEAHTWTRHRERQLLENSTFLQGIFDSIQDGISILNPDLTIRAANKVMKSWYGDNLPLEGKKCFACYHNSDRACDPCPSLRCLETGTTEAKVAPGLPGSGISWVELYSYPMRDPSTAEITGIIEFVRNITDRVRTQEELRQNQKLFTDIVENIPSMIFMKDAKDLTFYLVNAAAEELMGRPREELLGKEDYELFPRHEADFFRARDTEVITSGNKIIIPEEEISTPEGIRYVYTKKVPLYDDEGNARFMLGISEDITRRKSAEERVQSLLAEKELLLKEVHHRIKNNMNTIASMLSLQQMSVSDRTAARALEEAQGRIGLMSRIYEKLFRSADFESLDIKPFMEELIYEIKESYSGTRSITLDIDIDEFSLSSKEAFPLGIIINELLTNAFKYAFEKGKSGKIEVRMRKSQPDTLEVSIADNGRGVPEDILDGTSYGFGLTLIDAYTQQLDGEYRIENDGGTRVVLRMKVESI